MRTVFPRACLLVMATGFGGAWLGACGSSDDATKAPKSALEEEDPPAFVPASAPSMLPLPPGAGPPQGVVRRDGGTTGGGGDAARDSPAGGDSGGTQDTGVTPTDSGGG